MNYGLLITLLIKFFQITVDENVIFVTTAKIHWHLLLLMLMLTMTLTMTTTLLFNCTRF